MKTNPLSLIACLVIGSLGLSATASAQSLDFQVSLNTSALDPFSIYYAEFSLSDGSIASLGVPANNSALLSQFLFGGGSAGAVLPPNIGDAGGDMLSEITLADGDPGGVADLAEAFQPGSALDFDVHLTTNVDAGGVPDTFLFRLLDSNLNEIATSDPSGENGFVHVDLTAPNLTLGNVGAYGSDSIPAPTIASVQEVTPEHGSSALLVSGIFGSLLAVKFKSRRVL